MNGISHSTIQQCNHFGAQRPLAQQHSPARQIPPTLFAGQDMVQFGSAQPKDDKPRTTHPDSVLVKGFGWPNGDTPQWRVVVAPGSKPSDSWVEETEQHIQTVRDHYGPAIDAMLCDQGVEFRLARHLNHTMTGLTTSEDLFPVGLDKNTISIVRSLQNLPVDELEEEALFNPLAGLILKGNSDEDLLKEFANQFVAEEDDELQGEAYQMSGRIILAEENETTALTEEKRKINAAVGLTPQEVAIDQPTLLRHEVAHRIDHCGRHLHPQGLEFSETPAYLQAVLEDVKNMAAKNLIPVKEKDGTLIFAADEQATQTIFTWFNSFLRSVPISADGSTHEKIPAFEELFAELMAALHGGHGKAFEHFLTLYHGDASHFKNATPETFLQDYFPNAARHIREDVLPLIEKHYGNEYTP